MRRALLLSLLIVGTAAALAVGSYSALAGLGPVAGVASAVIGADDPDDGDVVNAVEADDADGDDVDTEADAADTGKGAQHIAEVIAGAFGASEEDVLELHQQDIGFGALFKLYAIARAKGMSVEELLATVPQTDGEYQFAFGQMMGGLSGEEQTLLESGPKNLGELVSAAHRGQGAKPENAADNGAGAASQEQGHGATGHAACSAATGNARARLDQLKGEGRPVERAIEAVTNCGDGGAHGSEATGEGPGRPEFVKAHGRR